MSGFLGRARAASATLQTFTGDLLLIYSHLLAASDTGRQGEGRMAVFPRAGELNAVAVETFQ